MIEALGLEQVKEPLKVLREAANLEPPADTLLMSSQVDEQGDPGQIAVSQTRGVHDEIGGRRERTLRLPPDAPRSSRVEMSLETEGQQPTDPLFDLKCRGSGAHHLAQYLTR